MSDGELIVSVSGLAKEFATARRRVTLFRALQSAVVNTRALQQAKRRSLDNIGLEVRRGDVVGLVGENGAGKTTLLKTIAGLYVPTEGSVRLHGEVVLLAGLGHGMVDELTVLDNIGLYGAVCRIRRESLRDRADAILEWAELESFRDAQLRTLSTGMRTRLAFAIAMHIDADVVLMDEAFSAGDKRFQQKCNQFFVESKERNQTFVVATHNMDFVTDFCNLAVWLRQGCVEASGDAELVLEKYVAAMGGSNGKKT